MTTVYARHPSPLGEILLVAERDGHDPARLRGAYLPEHRGGPAVDPTWAEDAAVLARAADQLDAYFAGQRTDFDIPLDLRGTPFQRRVWDELRAIPYASTISYAELARRIGRPSAARAVGSAVARNPVSVLVPCHRVVGAGGDLTGYAGGLERKASLLDLERRVAAERGATLGTGPAS